MLKPVATPALSVLVMAASALAAEKPYSQPTAVIPYARSKPVIDGIVDDNEWQGGFSQQALHTTAFDINARKISGRQSRFWVMWDEENLYVAMRSTLRPGERPLQVRKGLGGDQDDVIRDDAYEICISMGATDPQSELKNGTTQYIGTFTGAYLDAWLETPIGERRAGQHFPYNHAKSRIYSYDAGWVPKNRITASNDWEMEVVIPRASLGTTKGPFRDGMSFGAILARHYQRPLEVSSFSGTFVFQPWTHSTFVLSKTAPSLQLLAVGDATAGTIGPHVTAFGQSDGKIAWRYASEAVTREGTAEVKKGELVEVVNLPDLDVPGEGNLRFTVTEAAGATLLDWQAQRAFGPVSKEEIKDIAPAAAVAETPAPAPKTPAQLGITLGYPVVVAEQTGHLWFPKIEVLPGGRLQVVCSGQPDSGQTSGAFQTTSTDQGKTWAPLAPWRYGGVTSWREDNLQVGLPWDYTYDNQERTALRGELVAVDTSGQNVDLPNKAVRITGFPRPLAEPSHGHTSSFTTDCDGVVLKGKRILTLGYGTFAGDEAKHRKDTRSRDSYFGYSVMAIESLDGGRNWRYLTTVCDWTDWENDPGWVDQGRFEGPCESSLVELADGSLLAVYRTGMFEQNPISQSISTDGGKTWSEPKPLPAFGVLPSLQKLANGGLILATGRPGIWLWYSADGRGETWEPIDAMAHHNAAVEMDHPEWLIRPTMQFNRFHTSSNVRIREIAPNTLLLIYDRIPLDWQAVPKDSPERNQVFVLPVQVGGPTR